MIVLLPICGGMFCLVVVFFSPVINVLHKTKEVKMAIKEVTYKSQYKHEAAHADKLNEMC